MNGPTHTASLLTRAHPVALAFDAPVLRSFAHGVGAEAAVLRGWVGVWGLLHEGAFTEAVHAAEAGERDAAGLGDAALVVEMAALRALALSSLGDLEAARTAARRASRMARTEAIPEQEYVAHIVLSRVRRLTGHPHLAARILASLGRVAPAPYRAWIAWELLMAGASCEVLGGLEPTTRGDVGALALGRLLMAADACDGAGFAEAGAVLAGTTFPPFLRDAVTLLDAVDPMRAPGEAARAWCRGVTTDSPDELHGLLTRAGNAPSAEPAIAYVRATPDGPGRRLPRTGYAFAFGADVRALPQSRRKQGRNEMIIAALALAQGHALPEQVLFEDVYGFGYVPEMHRGVLSVCLHRTRDYLGDAGTLEQVGGEVRLRLALPILVPDPRCAKPMHNRLLRAVAERREASAKDISKALGISLRVAQSALAELSADGACVARKVGREVRYEVEDTTFSEPTAMR